MATEIIKIGQHDFTLNFSENAYRRRSNYYKNFDSNIDVNKFVPLKDNIDSENFDVEGLTNSERALLSALGIDNIMERSLQKYMPDFFQSLLDCNTDTKLTLSKQCELPYFIIWSTLFANKRETYKRLEDAVKSDFDIDSIARLIHNSLRSDEYNTISQESMALFKLMPVPNIYAKLFTLIYEDNKIYDNLFTLIYKPA